MALGTQYNWGSLTMQINAHLGTTWPHQILLCMVRDQFIAVVFTHTVHSISLSLSLSIYVYMIATCSQPHGINVQMFLISVQNWKSYFKELQTMECWDNFRIFTFSFNVGITSFHIWKKIAVLCLFVIELHGNREGRRRISSKGGNDSWVRSMVS